MQYEIRVGSGLPGTRTFDDPRKAAAHWFSLPEDGTVRLQVLRGDGEVAHGTPAEVKPVYDALRALQADHAAQVRQALLEEADNRDEQANELEANEEGVYEPEDIQRVRDRAKLLRELAGGEV